MGTFVDLTGLKFGFLTVKHRGNNKKDRRITWICECICGNQKEIAAASLRNGDTKSCGCYAIQQSRKNLLKSNITHNCSKNRIYSIWKNMRQRCLNKKCISYKYYGAKGISYDPSWQNFENFLNDMGHPPSKKHQLERIDSTQNYSKDNCIWILPQFQNLNRSSNRKITFKGKTRLLKEWSDLLGIHKTTIASRLDKLGWSVEKSLTTSPKKHTTNTD